MGLPLFQYGCKYHKNHRLQHLCLACFVDHLRSYKILIVLSVSHERYIYVYVFMHVLCIACVCVIYRQFASIYATSVLNQTTDPCGMLGIETGFTHNATTIQKYIISWWFEIVNEISHPKSCWTSSPCASVTKVMPIHNRILPNSTIAPRSLKNATIYLDFRRPSPIPVAK